MSRMPKRWDGDEIMNSIVAIHPYMTEGVWVFDDAAV